MLTVVMMMIEYLYMMIRFAIVAVCLSLCQQIIISLRAERRMREARRKKFTHENCAVSTIHLGPAGRRPPWPSDDDDDDDDDDHLSKEGWS